MSDINTSTGQQCILLVDDYAPLARNSAFLLNLAGFEVVTASDGLEALDCLRQRTPDLIISDIDMPRLDGYDLLRQVRAQPEWVGVPFIFISGRYTWEDLMLGLELGADDYVPKPFDIYDLLDAIGRTLARPTPGVYQRKAG